MDFSYSAAIPTKNRPEELRHCIRQILKQKIKPEKIIVLDDGDLQKKDLIDFLGSESHRLVFHKKRNKGLISSLNLAPQLCETPWLLLLDDDIYLQEDFMEKMENAVQNYHRKNYLAGLAGYPLVPNQKKFSIRRILRKAAEKLFMMNGGVEGTFLPSGFCCDYGNGHHPEKPYRVQHVPGGLGLWRKSVLLKFRYDQNYKDYAYGNDKEFAYRVSRKHHLVCVPGAEAIHDKSPESRISLYRLGRMKTGHQYYFYHRVFRKNILSPLFFWWSMGGMVLIYFTGAIFSADPCGRLREVRGMMQGLRDKGVIPRKQDED